MSLASTDLQRDGDHVKFERPICRFKTPFRRNTQTVSLVYNRNHNYISCWSLETSSSKLKPSGKNIASRIRKKSSDLIFPGFRETPGSFDGELKMSFKWT